MAGIIQPKSELFEKPKPVKLGKVFKQKVVVQHRSDRLIQEEVENVQNVQDALKNALEELETAQNAEEVQFLQQQVTELKEKTDQMIIVLKIVQKINTELQYARHDLQKKLKLSEVDSNEINRTRKRVGWLEDRMEIVLGRKRQRSAHRVASLTLDPRSMLQSERNRGERGGYISDYSSYIPRGHSPRSDTNSPLHRATHHFTDDSEMSYPLPLPPKVEDIQRHILEEESKPTTREMKRPADNESREDQTFITQYPQMSGLSNNEDEEDTPFPPSTASPLKQPQDINNVPQFPSEEKLYYRRQVEEESDGTGSEAQYNVVPPIPVNAADRKREESEDKQQEDVETTTKESSDRSTNEKSGENSGPGQIRQELSKMSTGIMKSEKRIGPLSKEGSRVTVLSPREELLTIEEREDGDATERYWNSEHHRFEWSEYVEDIVEMNPTSYHTMGLAVPGTFVENPVDTNNELPWRKRTDSEISDVHQRKERDMLNRERDWKTALDKLSVKIHKMHGRVKEASMLSVKPDVISKAGPNQLLQALEKKNIPPTAIKENGGDGPDTPSTIPPKPTLAKFGLQRPSSTEISGFPVVNPSNERLGTSMSGRIIYRPNPLPYPDKLPVTKVNGTKEYPPLSHVYSQSVPGRDPASERIVNQRNLYNETKFTSSLYRSKPNRSSEIPEQVQQNSKQGLEEKKNKKRKKKKKEIELPEKAGIRGAFNLAKAAVKFRGQEKWSEMKPKSGALKHTGLKWERVKSIVHNNLVSVNVDERVDAARHLGLLRVCDTMVLYALRERLKNDDNNRVVYEAAKSLITLGAWEEEALNIIVLYLLNGNTHIRADLIKTMIFAKNVQYIDKRLPVFADLVRLLSVMCLVDSTQQRMSFDAAVCMGRMCVYDENAKNRLQLVVQNSNDTHMKAEALDILIRQMNENTPEVVRVVLEQLSKSAVWKYRVDACKLLITMGPKYVTPNETLGMEVYNILERKLWDDPSHNVRFEVAKAMAALEMFPYACETVEKKLEDQNEEIRAQAVISVGTLGMKNERILRHLMEMIDLDSSEYVRLMIIRTFISLHCLDRRILRLLRDKEKGDGILAREAAKAIEYLDSYATILEQRKMKKNKKHMAN